MKKPQDKNIAGSSQRWAVCSSRSDWGTEKNLRDSRRSEVMKEVIQRSSPLVAAADFHSIAEAGPWEVL